MSTPLTLYSHDGHRHGRARRDISLFARATAGAHLSPILTLLSTHLSTTHTTTTTSTPNATNKIIKHIHLNSTTMPPPTTNPLPLPDHLRSSHLHTLQSLQPLCFVFANVNVSIIPSIIASGETYEEQKYLRIWDRNGTASLQASTTAEMPQDGETIGLNHENIYRVYGQLKVDNSHMLLEEHSHAAVGYLLSATGEAEAKTKPTYYFLQYHDSKPVATDEGEPVTAFLTGPVSRLPHILDHSISKSKETVSVLFSSAPTDPDDVVPPLYGQERYRGDLDLPEKASRSITFQPHCYPKLTSANWEKLLCPIGREVDKLCPSGGTLVSLRCRDIYSPRSGDSIKHVAVVTITAQPKSFLSATETLYQVQHILCRRGIYNLEVHLVVGRISRYYRKQTNSQVIEYHQQPHMSDSIGCIRKDSYGGSVGGYVSIPAKGGTDMSSRLFVMTCDHCVFNYKEALTTESQQQIFSPTPNEVRRSQHRIGKKLLQLELNVEEPNPKIKNEVISKRLQQQKQRDFSIAQSKLAELHPPNGLHLEVGIIFKSSGKDTTSARHTYKNDPQDGQEIISNMDWALISVDTARLERFPYNTVSSSILLSDDFLITQDALKDGTIQFNTIRPDSDEDCGKRLVKVDKYRDVQYGTANPRRARTRLNDTIGLSYEVPHAEEDGIFSVPGDSGSWVMDEIGNAVGMVFAGDSQVTCCIDIAEIVDDIKDRIGYEVVVADTGIAAARH